MSGMTTSRKAKPSAMAPITLRRLIAGSGMSITEAADRLRVRRETLHRWLNGTTPISRANALLVRDVLGTGKF